jgi:hypothetical protein
LLVTIAAASYLASIAGFFTARALQSLLVRWELAKMGRQLQAGAMPTAAVPIVSTDRNSFAASPPVATDEESDCG